MSITKILRGAGVSTMAFFVVASGAYAATTISTDIATGGNLTVNGSTTLTGLGTGAVHADSSGLLTSSLIVNADISGSAAIVDSKLATITTAGKVSNSATTATSANTASAIVARDSSGNFSAGTITGTFSGDGSSLTSLTKSQVGLSNVPNLDTSTTANITDATDHRFVTDAELTVLGDTSGTNTGDQDLSGYVLNTRTVNGHALSSDVTVTKSDVGLGNVTNDAQIKLSDLDTDGTLAADSDTKVASQKAVKTYVDGLTGGAPVYAQFYGLTAGTGNGGASDYPGTVAVGAAVAFPEAGPSTGGIVSSSSTAFTLPTTGTYEIAFSVHTTELGQLELTVNSTQVPYCTGENMSPTAGGHPIQVDCLISATAGDVISVINPPGNASALTITDSDGSETHANAQTLTIKKL